MPPRRTPPSPLPAEPYWQSLPGSRALLHAIAEEPWDDGLRLILADWLEDHGESARAEFIRSQLRSQRPANWAGARKVMPGWSDEQHRLAREKDEKWLALVNLGLVPPHPSAEEQLLRENSERWLAGLPVIEEVRWDSLDNFERGLLEWLTLGWEEARRHLDAIFAVVDLRGLRVGSDDPCLGNEEIESEAAAALATMPSLVRLISLDISDNWLAPEAAGALVASPSLAGLSSLNLQSTHLGAREAVAALLATPHLARLSFLDLGSNHLGDEGACALAASPQLASLCSLNLESNRIGNAGAVALAASPHLARLSSLHLGWNQIGDEGAAALATSPYLTGLCYVNLNDQTWNWIGDQAAALLRARWPFVVLGSMR
jgi:uncharacterized protein (TIGR02996 family)